MRLVSLRSAAGTCPFIIIRVSGKFEPILYEVMMR